MAYSINFNPLSEEELLRIANQRVAPSYDEQTALYEKQTKKREDEYKQSLTKLDPTYERLGADIERQYEQKRQTVADAAMARGFGRSSYVTDVLGQAHEQQMTALGELARRKQDEVDGIAAKIETLYDDLMDNQSRLSSAKQNKILSTIDQLRLEQNARELEVMKYNADMAMREQQLQMQREQFDAQMAFNQSKASQDAAYRQQQMGMAKDEFAYRQQQDALKREAEAAAERARLEMEMLKLAQKGASSSKSSSSSSSKAKSSSAGIVFTGVRV